MLSMDDIKIFGNCTAELRATEYGYTPGVETATGPLGQGLANAVGMAVAEKLMAARFNQGAHPSSITAPGAVGDGCLMKDQP